MENLYSNEGKFTEMNSQIGLYFIKKNPKKWVLFYLFLSSTFAPI